MEKILLMDKINGQLTAIKVLKVLTGHSSLKSSPRLFKSYPPPGTLFLVLCHSVYVTQAIPFAKSVKKFGGLL